MKKEPLTKKQKQTLEFIKSFNSRFGYMPSSFDLSKKFNISVGGSTDFRFKSLIRKGWIKRKNKARSIVIL